MPEERPLQALVPLKLVGEAEGVFLVVEFEQVEHFGGSLHDSEGWRLSVVDEDRDAAIRIQPQEPILLLLIRADVNDGRGPLQAINILQLLKHDLHRLSIRSGLRDEMKTLGILDVRRGLVCVEMM